MISTSGGRITSLKTYSGSQIADRFVDNPWQFKITKSTSELINFGKSNNRHLIHGQLQQIPYHQLLGRSEPITIKGMNDIVAIPEGDSLYYRKVYELADADTVMKGKLVRKGFERIWNLIAKLGLTDTTVRVDLFENRSYYNFLRSLLPYSSSDSIETILRKHLNASLDDIEALRWLGLFEDDWLEGFKDITPTIILQHLLERIYDAPDEKDST